MAAVPDPIAPMLATEGELPTGGWSYEYKWDGYRCCLQIGSGGETRLTSRRGGDVSATYPDLDGVLRGELHGRDAVLDGEIVALGDSGRPEFARLQTRHLREPTPMLLRNSPVLFFAFDILRLGGTSLLEEPYEHRRNVLAELAPPAGGRVVVPPYYTEADINPAELLSVVERHGLEGIVAKKLDSTYQPGQRSRRWIKRALFHAQEVVLGGWRPGNGRRERTFGALLLGMYDDRGRLCYVGDVGTGFTDQTLDDLLTRLAPLEQDDCPFTNEVPRERARRVRWVEPTLVGEVVHRNWTPDGRLRHTTWRGLRIDKDPEDVKLP